MESKEVFVDTVGQMHLVGGMVRIDFTSMQPSQGPDGKRIYIQELKERVIMNPEGFLQSFATMQRFLDQMIESGVIRRNPDATPRSDTDGEQKKADASKDTAKKKS